MKVILFGATGMVGQGVLRECLQDPAVTEVLSIGRQETHQIHPKLRELVHHDFTDFSSIQSQLAGYDACFFCLGISSAGLSEETYTRITYDFTLAAARLLAEINPGMTFVYVSGTGTDSTEQGRSMWARVKGKTENALLRLPLEAFMFRPGWIQPGPGIVSKTRLYRVLYAVFGGLYPVIKALFPNQVTTSECMGRAMLTVAKHGAHKRILDPMDINQLGQPTS